LILLSCPIVGLEQFQIATILRGRDIELEKS
jgi:hypothetical protein